MAKARVATAHRADVSWDLPSLGWTMILETVECGAREWHDRPESREPGWQVLPLSSAPGRVLAIHPTFRRI
jgi:hypothetical protein